jgi:endonuclease III
MSKETIEEKKVRFKRVYNALNKLYPDTETALEHENAFELLTATILSAQCTDARVNIVMHDFRPRFPNPTVLANAKLEEIEKIIKPTGFFRQKAKSLKSMATDLITKFGGEVPKTMDELTSLRGVGRKTANVVLGNAFDITEGIAVDTHVTRLANRLNFTTHSDPKKIEKDLMTLTPKKNWTTVTHLLISHGRAICNARKPKCPECAVADDCPSRDLYYK